MAVSRLRIVKRLNDRRVEMSVLSGDSSPEHCFFLIGIWKSHPRELSKNTDFWYPSSVSGESKFSAGDEEADSV